MFVLKKARSEFITTINTKYVKVISSSTQHVFSTTCLVYIDYLILSNTIVNDPVLEYESNCVLVYESFGVHTCIRIILSTYSSYCPSSRGH